MEGKISADNGSQLVSLRYTFSLVQTPISKWRNKLLKQKKTTKEKIIHLLIQSFLVFPLFVALSVVVLIISVFIISYIPM